MSNAVKDQEPTTPARTKRYLPGLERLSGRLRLDVGERPVATLVLENGDVELQEESGGPSDAVAICDSRETMAAIQRGELNPVVASLQNRLELTGDRAFAIRLILGLHGNQTPEERRES